MSDFSDVELKQIRETYGRRQRPLFKKFTKKTLGLLKDLLAKKNFSNLTIISKTKKIKSFMDKVRQGEYRDPLNEISDCSGIRIITRFQNEVDLVKNYLSESLEIIKIIDKRTELGVAEFGYLSLHMIAKLDTNRNKLDEWRDFKELKFEIQIRTMLQDAWANVSHALHYKKMQDIPKKLKRKMPRLASLFELADEEFLRIKAQSDELNKSKKAELKKVEEVIFSDDFMANQGWSLNFWGSKNPNKTNRIENNSLIFEAKDHELNHKDGFGAFYDLRNNVFEGFTYEISCQAKSETHCTMKLQLWIHDTKGGTPRSVFPEEHKTPSEQGETYKTIFKVNHTKAMRIHLYCKGGNGRIIVDNVTVKKIKSD